MSKISNIEIIKNVNFLFVFASQSIITIKLLLDFIINEQEIDKQELRIFLAENLNIENMKQNIFTLKADEIDLKELKKTLEEINEVYRELLQEGNHE